MATATKTETLDALYTTTWQLRKKELVDNIFTATPFWYLLTKAGKRDTQEGGRFIEIPLEYAKNETVTWFGKGNTISIAGTDPYTVSQWDWRYVAASIVRYYTDDHKNRGKAAQIKKVNADLDNAVKSLIDDLETKLFTAQTGLNPNGLPTLVANAPGTGTVGNYDRATNSWWRNQFKSMSGEAAAVYLRKRMNKMYNDCGKYGQASGTTRFPTSIICAQDVYEMYEDEAVEYGMIKLGDQKLADLGFGDLAYKGRPITWSPAATDGYMYFLNHNNLYWIADSFANFDMTPWKGIPDQLDRVAQITAIGNLVASNCAKQGVIFSIAE